MKEPLRQRKKNQTRAAIIDKATRIFRRKGFEASTLDEIAEAANVHKQTVLRYFTSKEEIAFARRIATFQQFEAELDAHEGPVLAYWRDYISRATDATSEVGAQKSDELRVWYDFIDSDHRLFAYQLRLNERYQTVLARALSREAGVEPDNDTFAVSVAALLVCGNYNAARMGVRNGDAALKARLLDVVDLASQLRRDTPAAAAR